MKIPDALGSGPFTTQTAKLWGVSEKVLRGKRFRRLHPCVWVLRSHTMTDLDWIRAAELALPERARASHMTRLRKLGLDYEPVKPVHMSIQGELHLDLDGIILHRTKVLPPTDDDGLTPAAAFVGYAASARVIDLIKVGDWLLHHGHMTIGQVLATAGRDSWRPGSNQASWITQFLDERSRSLKESETRALLEFAGLPKPEVNVDIYNAAGQLVACVDLLYRLWQLVVEYEGRQHAEDPAQFNKDIGRYAAMRGEHHEYIQVTQEMLRQPRATVLLVHTKLVERGYTGPPPEFARHWQSLFGLAPTRPPVRR